MSITTVQNNSVTFDIRPYLPDRGWSIVGTRMVHQSENLGYFEVPSYGVQAGQTYQYSFQLANVSSGGVIITIGGASSELLTTSGYHQGEITTIDNSSVRVWSDGDLEVVNLTLMQQITDSIEERNTITWSEQRKGWVTFKEIMPDAGFSMFTRMFTFKDGNLWAHQVEGTTPNNFYGEQKSSRIKFPVSSVGVKTYQSIAVHSNKVIGTTENGIQTQLGNVTDLISYDFESREGIHYANKLRDAILDDKLKGRYIVIELTDEESANTYLQLFKVVIKSNISTPNE